ncbi:MULTISPECIES: caspase family protein [unclassified Nocardia]|uniref:caspase, EACC1-associated type n=1 Tax=unclassified Nocardia TaxID=2637762 RepID=UPI001CE471D3|nr:MULTISPECIES: caspase family protein [unclassified Nocardia]
MRLPDPDRSYAVLIGTARYGADSGFPSFSSITRSVRDFGEFLRNTTGLTNVVEIVDPPDPVSFATALTAAADAATDLLLFYYVGHGVAVGNELHLAHSGSHAEHVAFTTVPYPAVRAKIRASRAKVKIVILDCCHSGKAFGRDVLAGPEVLREAADIDGTFVLTATDEKTKFAVAQDGSGRTAFTGVLLDIMASGIPGAERYLTMSALFRELRSRLPAANLPKPKALERGTAAELALAVNAGCSGAAPALPGTETTAYFAQIRDIAPADELRDREQELATLAAFCAGGEPYLWCRAGPWAGKTALLSWFALHPPENVRVVAFFITSRLAAQADHLAFDDAVLEQLSALLPAERTTVTGAVGNRDALRRHLLDLAERRAIESGKRIVLIVDGLDEDQGAPSIASLLPRNPGPGLRVLVASRPNPPIPLDVPDDHPLRTCTQLTLKRSPWASGIIRAAQWELRRLLAGSEDTRRVLGLVTAAGGLTNPELEDLTQLPPFRIEEILDGVTGRTFRTRMSAFVPDQINLLAHETLQQESENALGKHLLDRYRAEIHAWADRYRADGWPGNTPSYLLTRYFSMLKALGDAPRMTALALDADRHDRMLHLTGGDITARTEIAAAAEIVARQPDPDLLTLCRLAMRRDRLRQRSDNIPIMLPAAFARLGECDRAASLAISIPDQLRRTRAHIALAAVPRAATEHERDRVLAESLIREIGDAVTRESLYTDLIGALLAAGDTGNAEKLLEEVAYAPHLPRALSGFVPVWLAAGREEEARETAARIEFLAERFLPVESRDRARVLAAEALAVIGEYRRAESVARAIADKNGRIEALAGVIRWAARAGQRDRVREMLGGLAEFAQGRPLFELSGPAFPAIISAMIDADHAEDARRIVTEHEPEPGTMRVRKWGSPRPEYVTVFVMVGALDTAERCANEILPFPLRADVLTDLIPAFLAAGRRADGRRLADAVEAFANRLDHPGPRAVMLSRLVRALIDADALDLARAAVGHIQPTAYRIRALAELAKHLRSGPARELARLAEHLGVPSADLDLDWVADASKDFDSGLMQTTELIRLYAWSPGDLAREIESCIDTAIDGTLRRGHGTVLSRLAAVLVEVGRTERAIELLTRIDDVAQRIRIMTELAAPLAAAGAGDQLHQLLLAVEPLVAELPEDIQPTARTDLGIALARIGDIERADRTARGFDDVPGRAQIQTEIVAALVRSGDIDAASALAARISYVHANIHAELVLVPAIAERDGRAAAWQRFETAERSARDIHNRDQVALHLVETALRLGDTARATASAALADSPIARAEALVQVAQVLVTEYRRAAEIDRLVLRPKIVRLLAEIWNGAVWYRPLDVLARLDPGLLTTIADEVLTP